MKTISLENEAPERLDKALVAVSGGSRAAIQSLIKAGRIFVNGNRGTMHKKVTKIDIITIEEPPAEEKKKKVKPPTLDILYEDSDVVVVNKPAGLLTHPASQTTEPTLVDALVAHDKKIAKVGDDKNRSGIVHRLDRDASGVLIVAKTNAAFAHLKKQFQDRLTKKIYSVLVHGVTAKDHDTITLLLGRSGSRKGRMAARPASQNEGREAITHYDVVERYPHLTLLSVRIETGRTHQIRSHLFAIGHGVVGDRLYAHRGVKPGKIDRLFLHAKELTITLPNGEEKTFTAPLPKTLTDFLATLKKHKTKVIA